jgi:hypothetical protein
MEYLDFLGRPLAVGDYVILIKPRYRELLLARITKFTPKQVRVVWGDKDWDQMIQHASQLCKVEGPDLTLFLLKK